MWGQDTILDDEDGERDVTEDQEEPLHVALGDRKLVTQPYDLSLATLKDDIERERLLLNIEYQRKYVWDRSKGSRLIESLLLNIPVPVCYFAENEDGTYEVIDGLQRIKTIYDFLSGDFALRGLPVMTEVEGLRYEDLSIKDQRRLSNRTIRCIVITEDSHPDIKFDVFERLNSGAVTLHAQELRNCIYRGKFNTHLRELSDEAYFTQILGGLRNSRMAYEELALRYFALYEGLGEYRPPLRQQLNSYMRRNRATLPSAESLSIFKDTCNAVHEVYGSSAFRLVRDGKEAAFNRALFDALMLPTSFADRIQFRSHAAELRALRNDLLGQEEFQAAIGRATADRSRVFTRIRSFADGMAALGVSCSLPELPDLD